MTRIIWTGVTGRSPGPVRVVSMDLITSIPPMTFPNTGCLDGPGENQSRYALLTVLMKNYELPLLGRPVLAIERVPGSFESFALSGCSSSMQPSGPLPVPARGLLGSRLCGQPN